MTLSEKYKSDNVTGLITEQTQRLLGNLNKSTKLIVIVGEQGSGKTTLARYIQDKHTDFEISDDLGLVGDKKQLEKLRVSTKNIVTTTKLCDLNEDIVDNADIIICTSNKDTKVIIDRLKYIVLKEGIKVNEIELVEIADKHGQNIRGAINYLHNFIKKK